MKELQKNFTTPEQANRLLELGVPENTADCFYYEWAWFPEFEHYGKQLNVINWQDFNEENRLRTEKVYPCWSVGRLIEISRTCTTLPDEEWMFPFWKDVQDNVEWAIKVIESAVRTEHIDFSKLN